jgi:hypothetical protein
MTTGATWPKNPFKPSKIISLEYSADAPQPCPSIFGANSYLKSSSNYSYSNNRNCIQTYQHTCMSMNNTTTTNTHSSLLAWKLWFMTNPTNLELLPNTATRLLCWAPPLNTTNARNFGWSAPGQPASQAQPFSNINTSLTQVSPPWIRS